MAGASGHTIRLIRISLSVETEHITSYIRVDTVILVINIHFVNKIRRLACWVGGVSRICLGFLVLLRFLVLLGWLSGL